MTRRTQGQLHDDQWFICSSLSLCTSTPYLDSLLRSCPLQGFPAKPSATSKFQIGPTYQLCAYASCSAGVERCQESFSTSKPSQTLSKILFHDHTPHLPKVAISPAFTNVWMSLQTKKFRSSHSTSVGAIHSLPSVQTCCKATCQYGVRLKSYSPAANSYSIVSL